MKGDNSGTITAIEPKDQIFYPQLGQKTPKGSVVEKTE